jgi:hypothetical protein
MDDAQGKQEAERRRREVVARITGSEQVMAQHRASRAAKEREVPFIPGREVFGQAKKRRRRA